MVMGLPFTKNNARLPTMTSNNWSVNGHESVGVDLPMLEVASIMDFISSLNFFHCGQGLTRNSLGSARGVGVLARAPVNIVAELLHTHSLKQHTMMN